MTANKKKKLLMDHTTKADKLILYFIPAYLVSDGDCSKSFVQAAPTAAAHESLTVFKNHLHRRQMRLMTPTLVSDVQYALKHVV